MFEGYDETELLGWVEGEIDPRAARSLEARLVRDPAVRSVLEAMRADREGLRSLETPAPPSDLIAAMEARLARPMLIEHRPGAYRRAHRRPQRRSQIVRMGALAAAAVVAVAAAWIVIATLIARRPALAPEVPSRGTRVEGDAPDGLAEPATALASAPGPADEGDAAWPADWPPAGTTVHHHLPIWSTPDSAAPVAAPDLRVASATGGLRIASEARAAGDPIVAPFAVVVRAEDGAAAEKALVAALDALPRGGAGEAALVRNFSVDEARSLLEEHLIVTGRASGTPGFASGDLEIALANPKPGGRTRGLIADGLREARRRSGSDAEEKLLSRQLCGDAKLAASYERQLELSSRGATHTLTLDARDVAAWLERLRAGGADVASLRPLDDEAANDTGAAPTPAPDRSKSSALGDWVAELRVIQSAAEELRAAEAQGRSVLLPVIVETKR